MKKILIFIAFSCVACLNYAQVSNEYKLTLKQMFEASGTEASYKAAIEEMFAMFKQQYPTVSDEIWNEFKDEFMKTSLDDLTEMLAPVYSKHLTQKDLQEIIKFHETPTGKKFANSTPLIMQESMQVGQQWGMKLAQEFEEKMREKGY